MPMLRTALLTCLALTTAHTAWAEPPAFTQVAPGVCEGLQSGRRRDTDPPWRGRRGGEYRRARRNAGGGLPARGRRQSTRGSRTGKVALRFPSPADEDVYGLGVDFTSMRRTRLDIPAPRRSLGRASRPHARAGTILVSTKGYGVFIDSARSLTVNVGLGVRLTGPVQASAPDRTTEPSQWTDLPRSDAIEALVPAGGVAHGVYIFAGPTPLDAVRRYNLFGRGGALPPKWGLGFHDAYTARVHGSTGPRGEIAAFRARGIPLDMLGPGPGLARNQCLPDLVEWGSDPVCRPEGIPVGAREAARAREPVVQPVRLPTAPLYRALLPYAGSHLRMERHRPRLLDARVPAGLRGPPGRKSSASRRVRSAGFRSTRWTDSTCGSGPTSPSSRRGTTASS